MRTLLENITMVKGVEYFVVIAFCFGFIALWILVHASKGTQKKIVAIVIPLALVFAGGAIALNKYFSQDLNTDTTEQNNANTIENSQLGVDTDYLAISYGPATEFHKVMSDKIACTTCHHNSKDIKACKDCHNKPFNLSNPNKPGLKAAYHQRCANCHKDKFNGPNSCVGCHTGKTLQITVPTLHSLTFENCNRCHTDNKDSKIVYHDNCLTCHTKGTAGAPKLPDNHAERTLGTCQGCHKPKGG
jgi:hypothetical protein